MRCPATTSTDCQKNRLWQAQHTHQYPQHLQEIQHDNISISFLGLTTDIMQKKFNAGEPRVFSCFWKWMNETEECQDFLFLGLAGDASGSMWGSHVVFLLSFSGWKRRLKGQRKVGCLWGRGCELRGFQYGGCLGQWAVRSGHMSISFLSNWKRKEGDVKKKWKKKKKK